MPMLHRIGVRALAFGAACLFAQASSASEPLPLTSGSITLSGLTYTLIDLDPDDGMTPYALVTASGSEASVFRGAGEPFESAQSSATPFDGNSFSLTSTFREASGGVSPGGLHTDTAILRGDVDRMEASVFGGLGYWVDTYVSSGLSLQLSPNTAIRLEGAVRNDAKLDLSSLVDTPLLQGPDAAYSEMMAYTVNFTTVRLGNSWYYDPLFVHRVDTGQTATADGLGPLVIPGQTLFPEAHGETPFSLIYSNRNWAAVNVGMSFEASSHAWIAATPVPEASAAWYAFFGALGVMAWTGRCRGGPGGSRASWVARGLALSSALAATTASASGPVLAHGTNTLTALSYRLVDLDPDDGIAPSITFDPFPYTRLSTHDSMSSDGNNTLKFVSGGFGSGATGQTSDPTGRGEASRSASGLAVEATIGLSEAQQYNGVWFGDPANGWEVAASLAGSPFNRWGFTLSARTAVVLEGHSKAELTMDLSPLVGSPLLQGPEAPYGHIDVRLWGEARARLLSDFEHPPEFQEPVVIEQSTQLAALRGSANVLGWQLLPDYWPQAQAGGFDLGWSIQYANLEGTAQRRAIDLGVNLTAQVVGVIPEPGSAGLALAGLAMMGAVLTGRRRADRRP